jgi:hypothetical protein
MILNEFNRLQNSVLAPDSPANSARAPTDLFIGGCLKSNAKCLFGEPSGRNGARTGANAENPIAPERLIGKHGHNNRGQTGAESRAGHPCPTVVNGGANSRKQPSVGYGIQTDNFIAEYTGWESAPPG